MASIGVHTAKVIEERKSQGRLPSAIAPGKGSWVSALGYSPKTHTSTHPPREVDGNAERFALQIALNTEQRTEAARIKELIKEYLIKEDGKHRTETGAATGVQTPQGQQHR